jgi:hypothetical protein
MTDAEYQAAIAAFLARKAVTRCPTVCVAPTRADISEDERAAYRSYEAAREVARTERLKSPTRLPPP